MNKIMFFFFAALTLVSCIGDDIIDDFVQPAIRISSLPQSLAVGEPYQVEAKLFGNTGNETDIDLEYKTSDASIATIDENAWLTGLAKGSVSVIVSGMYNGMLLSEESMLIIDEVTVEVPNNKNGVVATTSSYPLSGSFLIEETDNGIRIDFGEDYVADTRLPGLYIYLTNNKNTNVGALEIGRVQVFEGVHSYTIEGVGLDEYSHILYFCKPFSVKVGDGAIID